MAEVVVNVLYEDGTPKTPEEIDFEREQIKAQGDTPIVPGSQTDSALLLDSLKKEREKRRIAEETLALQGAPTVPSGSQPQSQDVQKLAEEIQTLKKENALKDLFSQFPLLKERANDFETYLNASENTGMSMQTAAKVFLVENGLSGVRRPGLEKPTGGDRQPPSTGMTIDEIRILRETDYRKYTELLMKGLIKIPK